jgi:rubrerythrin
MPTVSTTWQLLERAERVEVASARIYGALARRFRASPDVRALFARLELEEQQHASRIRLLAAHYRDDSKLPLEASADELEACLAEAARTLEEIEAGRWTDDLDEIRRRLRELEDRLSRAHAELLAKGAPPSLRSFFETLAQQDEAHARLLGA